MNEYKISVPRINLPKRFAKSPAKYLRKVVIDYAECRGLLTPENREEYLQRIDHEVVVFERPGLERSPGGGHGIPLQYSCLENPMDRGA